ncbi:MAG: DUF839 domain-containing protein [Saprospiraceae bacterium]|nr:DUF839 domain-containing protein [Saprospiraceae bacterium]
MKSTSRRTFLKNTGIISTGLLGLQSFVRSGTSSDFLLHDPMLHAGYGPLLKDPNGILNLPKGFTYKIISRVGDKMSDGFLLPGAPDAMATFQGPGNKVIVVRNHEVSPSNKSEGPFGSDLSLLDQLSPEKLYDYGRGQLPGMGGTTTFIYDPETKEIESQYLSLAGTIRNCAGGITPWNSWISCEEDVTRADDKLEKDHGYNFEVPAQVTPELFDPIPLKAMGRFNHEAVCVHPESGIVYQTEDRYDGLIYRFIPTEKGKLHEGKLQVLSIKGQKSFDTRNWESVICNPPMKIMQKYEVEWLDIDGIDAPEDDLRYRGYDDLGAARFARGEGMWYGDGEAYFACTNGGQKKLGQIFRYIPSAFEGQAEEKEHPATLEIFIEPNNAELVQSCDNLTVSANGDLVICEDRPTPRIVGVTPEGEIYHIARNTGYRSEFAGACFTPDGKSLFVNIQGPGLTIAINGPWGKRRS